VQWSLAVFKCGENNHLWRFQSENRILCCAITADSTPDICTVRIISPPKMFSNNACIDRDSYRLGRLMSHTRAYRNTSWLVAYRRNLSFKFFGGGLLKFTRVSMPPGIMTNCFKLSFYVLRKWSNWKGTTRIPKLCSIYFKYRPSTSWLLSNYLNKLGLIALVDRIQVANLNFLGN